MREKTTADRLAAFSDAVFAVIVTVMVLELRAPEQPEFSALLPLWPTAISYAVSYLFIAIIWINHHYLMRFVGPPTLRLIWINCAHPACIIPCRVLCRSFCGCGHCLQHLRAGSVGPSGGLATARPGAPYGEAPITGCSCDLHDRYARCVRRAAFGLRSDMRRPYPSPAARGTCQSAMTIPSGTIHSGPLPD
jgi:hypothetical protein